MGTLITGTSKAYDDTHLGYDCCILPFDFISEKNMFYPTMKQIISWCEKTLNGMFFIGSYRHYFEFEEDMVEFILTWN